MIEYSKSNRGTTRTTLTTHNCTAADISLPGETNDNAAFFPLAEEDQGLQLNEQIRAQFQCIDQDYKIYGHAGGISWSQIHV